MKKTLFLILFLSAITPQVQSQALIAVLFGKNVTSNTVLIGVQLGGNVSFQTNSAYESPRTSFAFGAYTNYRFSEKWHLNTFLTIKSNRGMMGLDTSYAIIRPLDSTLMNGQLDRKLTYIDINPEFQYAPTKSFAIGIGPVLSIMTKARDYYHDEGANKTQNEYNIYKEMNHIDVGISIDIQYTFKQGEGLSLNLKYIQGFLDPYKNGSNPSAVSSYLNFGVGIPVTGHGKQKIPNSR